MKRFGIHLRLLAAAVLLIGAATLTLGVVGVHMTGKFMHDRFEERIAFLARYLAIKSEVGVLINDRIGLQSLAYNLLGEKDVARVQILNKEGKELVDISKEAPEPLSMVETPVVFKRYRGEDILFNDSPALASNPFVKKPLKVEDYIGKVRIHFSTREINQLIVIIANNFTWLALGLALVAGFVFYLVSRPIGVELSQLTDTARRIGKGDFDLRVNPGKLQETRALSYSFNAMLDSLKESQVNLEAANREMMKQKAMAEMGRFAMMVAHEVKNPLAIIKSSLDLMKKDIQGAEPLTMAGYIEDEIIRLNRLIEDFLQFARPTKPTICEIDLTRMLQDVVERFHMMNFDNGRQLILDCDRETVLVQADRDLMMRVLSNIIKNAYDAVDDSGRIEVSATVFSDHCGRRFWQVAVSDNGSGIDEADLEQIFEPFFTTHAKGTGLGLAFAAQVCQAHGGILRAENRSDAGAVFTMVIPADGKGGSAPETLPGATCSGQTDIPGARQKA
jgi:signal transduction histidine kinase